MIFFNRSKSKFIVKNSHVWWKPSIQTYLILMNFIVLFFLFPLISVIFFHEEGKFRDIQLKRMIVHMRKSLESRSSSLVSSIALSAEQAIAGYDFTFLNIMVNQVVINDPEIIYCIIMDQNNKAMAHSDPAKIGSILTDHIDQIIAFILKNDFPVTIIDKKRLHYNNSKIVRFIDHMIDGDLGKKEVMEAVIPIYSGAKLWGILRCGYSLDRLHEEIKIIEKEWLNRKDNFKLYFMTMTGVFFSIGILIAALFTRSFVKSVNVLKNGVTFVSDGNLAYEIKPHGLVCTEFIELSKAFNIMTHRLRMSYLQLDEYNRSLEDKVAERTYELKEAQANLLQQAHEAGMAEMAVGILHNIGNAVTPAKVSASILLKRLSKSPIHNYLNEAMSQLQDVLVNSTSISDNSKNRFIDILKVIPATIKEEYSCIVKEIDMISDKHEHIESIIRLQMRYARLFNEYEKVDIIQVTEDALKMLEDSISKRCVKIIKKFSNTPLVKIAQAKLLQIIVNLIKNAYEAMDSMSEGEKYIIISIYIESENSDYIVLSIKDTGIGFFPQDKEKMFKFGYTTKSRGTGFGLHSCANYLSANNGSVSCYSDGKGKGAEFIVRLSADKDQSKQG